MSTISWETALKESETALSRRQSEIFVDDGQSVTLLLAKNEQGNFKNLRVVTRGGYEMYGVPCIEGEEEKTFYLFKADAKGFFDVAKNTNGRVVVTRTGKKNMYSE